MTEKSSKQFIIAVTLCLCFAGLMMCDIIIILLLIVHFYSPLTSPVDGGPLPSTLIAYTFTVIAVVGGQNEDVKMSNV